MKKWSQIGLLSLSFIAFGMIVKAEETVTNTPVVVVEEGVDLSALLADAQTEAMSKVAGPADLGVALGNPSVSGQTLNLVQILRQQEVRTTSIENLQRLRGEMWDKNPPYNGSPLRDVAAQNGLTTKEAYVNAITWSTQLEKKAIQRAVEARFVRDHIRPDGSGHDIGFENLAWGYSVAGAVYRGWGIGELNALIAANGSFNFNNGHLHNQLNPRLRSFAVGAAGGATAQVLSWNASEDQTGTGLTGSYSIPVKFSGDYLAQIGISLASKEYAVGETVRPQVTYNGSDIDVQVDISDPSVVDTSFVARKSGNVTFTIAGRAVIAKIVSTKPVYRLYHEGLQVHLYTTDKNERDVLQGRDWRYEGISWRTENSTGQPVYRLYQPDLKVHLYTRDANEYRVLGGRGWRQEGIAYRSHGSVPIYRLYHSGLRKHLYTRDTNEKNVLQTRGWRYEGVAWHSQP